MIVFSFISNGFEFCSVNHIPTYEKPGSKVFNNIKFFWEISNSWPNNILGKKVYSTFESC